MHIDDICETVQFHQLDQVLGFGLDRGA